MKREKYYWKKFSELIQYYNKLDYDDPARRRLIRCVWDVYDLWLGEALKDERIEDD